MRRHTGNLIVMRSSIHGRGVFVCRTVSAGHHLLCVTGAARTEAYDRSYVRGATWFSKGLNQWIAPPTGHLAGRLNHSCQPNAFWDDSGWITTIRKLGDLEEVLIDYATTELDPFWQQDCTCGARACRRRLRAAYLEARPRRRRLARLTPGFLRCHWRDAKALRSTPGG